MGTPNFAVPILKAIYKSDHKILEVYTQPATKSGWGQKINHSDIFNYSKKLNLKVRSPDTLETTEEINHIKKLNPDLVVVVAYGKILPPEMLNIEKLFFINGSGAFKKSSQSKSLLNFWAMSLVNSKCCFWSSPTGTWVAS